MRVVLLMGGSSTERDISFVTGRGVGKALESRGHDVIALDPATGKKIPLLGMETAQIGTAPGVGPKDVGKERSLVLAKSTDLTGADVVFVALHGGIGEDGTLQALLDLANIPYTGSGMLASALAMDKARAKAMFRSGGIPTPRGILLVDDRDSVEPRGVRGCPLVVSCD